MSIWTYIRCSKKASPVRRGRRLRTSILYSFAAVLGLTQSTGVVHAALNIDYPSNYIIWYDNNCSITSGSAPTGDLASQTPTDGKYQSGPGINKHLFIIVHTTEGDTAGAAEQALLSKGYSYHALIDQSGAEIRLLPDEVNAIGAGGANTNSLQVALVGKVGPDGGSHFDPQSAQLQTLSKQIASWATQYNIPIEKVSFTGQDSTHGVIGHIDVHAAASEGHTDPGANFPWAQVLANAKAGSGGAAASGTGTTAAGSSSPSGSSGGSSCCPGSSSGNSSLSAGSGGGGGCGEQGYASGKGGSKANEDQIWSFFKSKGLSDQAVAGILGNARIESSFMPDAVNPSGCIGVFQWCDRAPKLRDFAAQHGQDWNCLGTQLEFAWSELSGSESGTVSPLNAAQTPSDAAIAWNKNYERSGEVGENRVNAANDAYKDYTGKSASDLGSVSNANCSTDSADGTKNL